MAQTADEYWQELNQTYQAKFKSLKCYLNPMDPHFLIDPKILPCSNSACFECIRTTMGNSPDLDCPFCKQIHSNLNLNELKTNSSIIDQIDANSNEITDEMIDKLNRYIDGLTDKFESKNETIEKICVQAKKEVSERVEIIKAHLDALHQELLDMLAQIKKNVTEEIDRMSAVAADKCSEYETFAADMESMLADFEANRERLETEIYTCQSYMDDLSLVEQSFQRILRKVTFDQSDWSPDQSFICEYIGRFELNDSKDQDSDDD